MREVCGIMLLASGTARECVGGDIGRTHSGSGECRSQSTAEARCNFEGAIAAHEHVEARVLRMASLSSGVRNTLEAIGSFEIRLQLETCIVT